jgi:hypothetical protein
VSLLEMLSGRAKQYHAREAQAAAGSSGHGLR